MSNVKAPAYRRPQAGKVQMKSKAQMTKSGKERSLDFEIPQGGLSL